MAFKIGGGQSNAGHTASPTPSPAARPGAPARPGFSPRPQVQATRPPVPAAAPPRVAPAKPVVAKSAAQAEHRWSSPPPAKGSSYREYIDWACEQHLFYEDAEKLVLDIVTGKIEIDDEPSTPGMR